ncbi:MAG: hypothetical protein JSV26_04035 [bacterium]|nr:MAG: hypothetical protein JSV26_04035 [bacterium]
MAEKGKKQDEDRSKEETTKKPAAELEGFFKDFWGKVVEYASLGAEEASKVSSTAKMRVDIETLKFKRGKLAKLLGEMYFDEWVKDSTISIKGTLDTLRQIKKVDGEVRKLEREISKTRGKAKPKGKAPAESKTGAGKKPPPSKGKKAAKASAGRKAASPPEEVEDE